MLPEYLERPLPLPKSPIPESGFLGNDLWTIGRVYDRMAQLLGARNTNEERGWEIEPRFLTRSELEVWATLVVQLEHPHVFDLSHEEVEHRRKQLHELEIVFGHLIEERTLAMGDELLAKLSLSPDVRTVLLDEISEICLHMGPQGPLWRNIISVLETLIQHLGTQNPPQDTLA